MPHITHIEIVKYYRFFEVEVIGPSGRPVQTFICPTIDRAAIIGSLLIAIGARGHSKRVDLRQALPPTEVAMQSTSTAEIVAVPRSFPSPRPKPRLITSDGALLAGSVDDWVVDNVQPARGAKTTFREAYFDYQGWCQRRGVPALEPDQFGERLAKICEGTDVQGRTGKDGTVYRVGVQLASARTRSFMTRKTTMEKGT